MTLSAEKNSSYPRVLLVYNSRINKADQHGVSIRGWFGDWPKENLAQIYSGGEEGEETFCKYNFKIGVNERRLGKYFFKLKSSSFGQSSYPIVPGREFKTQKKISYWSLLKTKISELLINTGLWEIIFKPILSDEMIKFVKDFNPQIIYCQGYSLTFTWLPILLNNKFHIPICFQTGDDWPTYLYKDSPISFTIRPIIHRAVKSLLYKSSARLANSKLMANDYETRYGMSFQPLMMCDNLERFHSAISHRVVDDTTISIVYAGNLGQGRWLSIIELCEAAKLIQTGGINVMITAFATTIPPEAVNKLREVDNLQILPGPSHEELPSYLKGSDILYIAETFNPLLANEIRLSLSTKAHFYMMSEKPVLIYGSPRTGIVNYATEESWACIVQEQNLEKLSQALNNLITNKQYCTELVKKGLEVVSKYHSEKKVRKKVLTILSELVTI
jgi:glycosyltransferase involved in cell wall biosynthesis